MADGQNAITTDVAGVFARTSGIEGFGAQDLALMIGSVTVVVVFIWSAWYLRKVLSTGFNRANLPYMVTGVVLVIALMFLVVWVVGSHFTPG